MTDKWVKRWDVPSSKGTKTYVVAIDGQGAYGCSCPHWTNRRTDCRHIDEVKAGLHTPRGEEQTPRLPPEIVLANIREVMVETGEDGQPTGRILTPLYPIGDTWMVATIVHDLVLVGVPWSILKKRYDDITKRNSRKAIMAYVRQRGRRIYGPLVRGVGQGIGLQTYETVPVEIEQKGGD